MYRMLRATIACTLTIFVGLSACVAAASVQDGSLDPDFGSINGIGLTGIPTAFFFVPIPPVVQSDGKILICSTIKPTPPSTANQFFVARFTADGTLDTSFNGSGSTTVGFGGDDRCSGIALQPDGYIIVAGSTSSASIGKFAVARLDSAGVLDPGFGGGSGKVAISFGSGGNDDSPFGVAVQPDGKIVVAGSTQTSTNGGDFAVLRLNPDGTPDSTFNSNPNGQELLSFDLAATNKNDVANNVAIDRSGKIVLGGYSNASGKYAFAAARLLPEGGVDTSFNFSGMVTVPFTLGGASGSNAAVGYAMVLQSDGKIVLAGYADGSTTSTANINIAVARLASNGALDTKFGSGGWVDIPIDLVTNGEELGLAVAEQENGKLIAAGAAQRETSNFNVAVARLNTDGAFDSEFGVAGKETLNFNSGSPSTQVITGLAFQGTKIIASGYTAVGTTGGQDNVVMRLQTDLIFAGRFE
jgi:uncharacterized delta-60 repeat protein